MARSRRLECVTTRAIWDLFSPNDDLAVATIATKALLAGVHGQPARLMPASPLWGFLPSQGPDLLLVDDHNQVRVVVEHKRGAPAQVTSLATVDVVGRFADRLSACVAACGNRSWHQALPGNGCGCAFHTQARRGLVRAGVWQIDGYRASPWWLRSANRWHGITLANPRDVLWVLLDSAGRPAATAFDGAATAGVWQTTSYAEFRTTLAAALAARRLSSPGIPYVQKVLSLIS